MKDCRRLQNEEVTKDTASKNIWMMLEVEGGDICDGDNDDDDSDYGDDDGCWVGGGGDDIKIFVMVVMMCREFREGGADD